MDAHEEYLRRRRKALRIIAAVFGAILIVACAVTASIALPDCRGADSRPIEEIYRIETPTDTIAADSTHSLSGKTQQKEQPAPGPVRSPLDEAVPSVVFQ